MYKIRYPKFCNYLLHNLLLVAVVLFCGHTVKAACIDPDLSKISTMTSITMCDGTRKIGTLKTFQICKKDGQISCIADSKFKSGKIDQIDPSKIRTGVTIGGIIGTSNDYVRKNLSQCRNGVSPSNYNNDANPPGSGNVTSGTVLDWWDTVTENITPVSGFMGAPGQPWDAKNFCNGSQIKDVTGTQSWLVPDLNTINCSATTCTGAALLPFNRIVYDEYTGLYISNILSNSVSGATWPEAVNACSNITSGDGTNKWRLPTQKEIFLLYVGGIAQVDSLYFGGILGTHIWVATTQFGAAGNAYRMSLGDGYSGSAAKTTVFGVICVR